MISFSKQDSTLIYLCQSVAIGLSSIKPIKQSQKENIKITAL